MKSILVPTDFSDQATYALDLAYGIAKKNNAKLQLLNVVEAPHGSSFNATGEVVPPDGNDEIFFVQLVQRMEERLQAVNQDPKYSDIEIEGYVEIGSPYESISRTIVDHNVDLVVMGTQGTNGLEELLVGSNTEKVVRRAHCPVLTVKQPVQADSIKNIALATNLKDNHKRLIAQLTKLQSLFGATIHIVRVNSPGSFENDRYYKSEMKKFAEEHQLKDYTLNVYNESDEEDGIMYFAEDIHADMIALGTHGRSGIRRLLSGSIAEDLVNHSTRPVWTFRLQ